MHPAKKTIAIIALLVSTIVATAQKNAPVPKFKPPKVTTLLGTYSDSVSLAADEAAQLVSTPLKIIDVKNTTYVLSSYQFIYKRVTVSETEDGSVYNSSDMVASMFRTTPLPALWQSNVKENLKKGEMLYFFDVTVKDPQGRLFFAPDLKIYIR